MKKLLIGIFAVCLAACQKEDPELNLSAGGQNSVQANRQAPPSPAANPAFAFTDQFKQGNRSLPGLFVMDVNGSNVTRVYANYTNQSYQTPDYPAWSGDGSKLCFTLNGTDLYILNIAVVNGVPTGSGATKIGDGVTGGGSYRQGKWVPGMNQVACVWKKAGDPDRIHMLSTAGGSPTVLYSAPGTDWILEDDIAVNSGGTSLVFSERQNAGSTVLLKVLDIASGSVIKTVDLSQYKAVKEVDWAKSGGSTLVALTTVPLCDQTPIGSNGRHQLQTVDVSAALPVLNLVRTDVGNISWSPNDLQIGINAGLDRFCGGGCCFSSYFGKAILTLSTNNFSLPAYYSGNHHDWKR